MFFDRLYQELGPVPEHLTRELTRWCSGISPDQLSVRRENVFTAYDSRMILVYDAWTVKYQPALDRAQPLIDWLVQNIGHLDYPVEMFRLELSFVRPHSRVTEHYDFLKFHGMCDRIHVPLVSNDGSEFLGRWHSQEVGEDERYTIRPGHYTRLNNRVPHQAVNDSDYVRVHAIFDFIDARLPRLTPEEYRSLDRYQYGDQELTFRQTHE